MHRRHLVRLAALALAGLAFVGGAWAQADKPPVRILVGFPPEIGRAHV